MRKTLLLTTALLAGATVALAQNAPNTRQTEGASQTQQGQEHQAPGDRTTGQSTQREREGQNQRQGQNQERGNQRQGQAQQGQSEQGNAQNEERENQHQGQTQKGQRQQGNTKEGENQRQGTAQRRQQGNVQNEEPKNQRQGQAQHDQRRQGNAQNQGQERENQRQGQTQQGQGAQGTVNLTSEQRTKIRQDVFSGSNVPRVDNVNFSLRTGTVVPNEVRIVEVPETLVAIHPEWRGDRYFVVRDDLVVVDRDHRIIAVMPVGSSAAQREGGSQSGSLSLSQSEIREVQMKLNQKGFNVGEPDGVMGPKTKDGLSQFQRQQGLQERGDIDRETADALGISNAPSTTGSAPLRNP
jgi:hypothetical protein